MRTKMTILALTVLVGCGSKNPCDDYVEALCDCNEAECDALTAQYENVDADTEDVCAEKLDDAQNGTDESCETGGDDDGGALRGR